jgi:hypothetical protein
LGIVVVAAFIAANRFERPDSRDTDDSQIETSEPAAYAATATTDHVDTPVSAPAKARSASATSAPVRTGRATAPAPPAKLTPVPGASESESASATSGVIAAVEQPATPVTISGCLEQDDNTFRLKETSGEGAPKARSWKSGFLRKRTSSVELIDERRVLRLASHVGQRIETTGVLVDREMRVRSVRVQGWCD